MPTDIPVGIVLVAIVVVIANISGSVMALRLYQSVLSDRDSLVGENRSLRNEILDLHGQVLALKSDALRLSREKNDALQEVIRLSSTGGNMDSLDDLPGFAS